MNICNFVNDVSMRRKIPILGDDVLAFIDLGTKRCYYGDRSGHLTEFWYDRQKYFADNYETALKRSEASLEDDFEDLDATIKCRYYNTATVPGSFEIRQFALSEVVIGGLEQYIRHPEYSYTSNLDLYLLKPSATSTSSQVSYNCYKYNDNESMYDPMGEVTTTWPTGSSDISVYTQNDHKCGQTSLNDKYYKVIFDSSFPFGVVVDLWGDRCFIKDGGKIWKLRYDEFGKANACVDPVQESHRVYLYYDFKEFNDQKIDNKLYATKIPSLKMGSYKGSSIDYADVLTDSITCKEGDADEDTILLYPRLGMCYDTTESTDDDGNTVVANTWYNVCRETVDADEIKDLVAFHSRFKYGFQGTLDLCNKHCFIEIEPGEPGAADGATENAVINYYDLIFLNEFEAHCRDPLNPQNVIVRYNEEYEYYGNRGRYFSLTGTNDFGITKVELDLSLPHTAQAEPLLDIYGKPSCTVDGDAGWTLHYKLDNENKWCYQDDLYCEKHFHDNDDAQDSTDQGRIARVYFSNMDNHFTITKFWTENAGTRPFLDFANNDAPLRYQCLVDVFNGKCYFYRTPEPEDDGLTNASWTDGYDINLDQNVKTIFASIDNFTQTQTEQLIFECGPDERKFRLHQIMFLGFKNIIDVPECPKNTFKNPDTGICEHCMYECDDCESNDRCEDCLDIQNHTDRYLPCGPRCFSSLNANEATDWVSSATIPNKYWHDTDPTIPVEEICKPCPWNCKDCESATDCTSCELGYVLWDDGGNGECLSYDDCNNKFNFFADKDNDLCSECDSNCEDCSGSATNCLVCPSSNYKFFNFGTNEYNCNQTNCPLGHYDDSSLLRCAKCDGSCLHCQDGTLDDQCIDNGNTGSPCASKFFEEVITTTPALSICTNACLYKQFVDDGLATANKCRNCNESCEACDGPTAKDCTFCSFNRIYHDLHVDESEASTHLKGECISLCPHGMFEFTKYMKDTPDYRLPSTPVEYQQFIKWQPPEAQCLYDYNNGNIEIDMVPMFCYPCHSSCDTCFGPNSNHCSSCDDGSFLQHLADGTPNGCEDDCPDGYFTNTDTNTCDKCSAEYCIRCNDNGQPDVCVECQEGLYYDPIIGRCRTQCSDNYFINYATRKCELCDTSEVTYCVDYATKATNCRWVFQKPYLNTITNECVEICPEGTWDDETICRPCESSECDKEGNSIGTCDDTCQTCFGEDGDKCLTCPSGRLLMLDTWKCEEYNECPEGYRVNPSNAKECQPCKQYEKSCGISGAIECKQDILEDGQSGDDDRSSPDYYGYLLKGWPIRYCYRKTATPHNQCEPGWFEEDLVCKQCSTWCTTCSHSKFFCESCPTNTQITDEANDITERIEPYCFNKYELGRLCLCEVGMNVSVNDPLMELTIEFPNTVNVDWNYYLSNEASITGDKSVKDRSTLGARMKEDYDTKEYVSTVPSSALSTYYEYFNDLYKIPESKIIEANEAFQYRWKDEVTYTPGEYKSEVIFNEETSFGEQEVGKNLVKVLFEEQNWSQFGSFSYTTQYDSANSKKILKIQLGEGHLFNMYSSNLILRHNIIRISGCHHPYERMNFDVTPKITDLPTPIVSLTTNYGGDLNNKAVVPKCGRPLFTINYQNFPKGVPKQIKWTLFDDLQRSNGFPDNELRIALEEQLSQIPPQVLQYTLPADFAEKLIGYTAHIRVEATPFFTNDIAISTLTVKFEATGDYQLKFENKFDEFKFKRINDVWTPEMRLRIPPCLLTGNNESSIKDSVQFNLSFHDYNDQTNLCTTDVYTPTTTMTFDKTKMAFKIPSGTFPDTVKKCVTITSPVNAALGLKEYSYQFVLIPEHIFPLVNTSFGKYLEITADEDLEIEFSQVFDSDKVDVIVNTFDCETACGKTCDYLNLDGLPRRLEGTFEDVSSDKTTRKITFTSGQLQPAILYKITIFAKYEGLLGSKTIDVRVLKKDFNKLYGDWTVFGINDQGYGLAGFEASLKVVFNEKVEEQRDTFEWVYSQIDTNGNWQDVPLYTDLADGDNTVIDGYSVNLNHLVINSLEPEREHRVTLKAQVEGKYGEFVYYFSTLSGINIDFDVTPLVGTTKDMYTFSVDREAGDEEQLLFIWRYFGADGNLRILGMTTEDNYQNFIPQEGDGADKILGIQLEVKNTQRDTKRIYETEISNTKAQWSASALTQQLTTDQMRMALSAVSQESQQTLETVNQFFTYADDNISLIDLTTGEGINQYTEVVKAKINMIVNNLQISDDLGLEVVDGIKNNLVKIDQAFDEAALDADTEEDEVYDDLGIISKTSAASLLKRTEDLFDIYTNMNLQDSTGTTKSELAKRSASLRKYTKVLVSKVMANTVPGGTYFIQTEKQVINALKVDIKTPRVLKFNSGTVISNASTGHSSSNNDNAARRLQEDTEANADSNTDTTEAASDVEVKDVPNFNCENSFVMGPSTLSGYQNMIVSVTGYERETLAASYTAKGEQTPAETSGLGDPFCNPVEIAFQTSTPTGSGTTQMTLVQFEATYDTQRFSVCFAMDDQFVSEDWFGVTIRRYNRETQDWELNGQLDEQSTDVENRVYCWWVTKTGLYAPFEELNERAERLYSGFILYIMFAIDAYLIVCVIIAFCRKGAKRKLSKKAGKANHEKSKSVFEDKEYSGVNPEGANEYADKVEEEEKKDTELQNEGGEEVQATDGADVVGDESDEHSKKVLNPDEMQEVKVSQEDAPRKGKRGDGTEPKFCESFVIYHRLLNVCFSTFHELHGAGRVFSFCLQLAILCNLVGLLTYALDFGNTAAEATVGYVICFFVLRIVNLLFYKTLLYAQRIKGAGRVLIVLVFVLLFIACHFAAVFVTLEMEESDFTAWTIAFFVTVVVDLLLWELIVTCWQMGAVRVLQSGKKPMCEWVVSSALRHKYGVGK